jgi:hypothetical protein
MCAFKPYTVVASRPETDEVVRECNRLCYPLSVPLEMTNALGEYALLLLLLKTEPRIEVAPLAEQLAPLAAQRVRVMIRHDVDHDLVCAVEMSQLEQAFGLAASYYLHHASSYYYGRFDSDGLFHRYEGAAPLYRRIQANGAEVGLHADPFAICQRGIDGIAALRTELDWLRSQGLKITGTTAHGSAPYYGAENFEVFRQYKVLPQATIELGGEPVALGCLSAEQLGLCYEGNFPRPVRDARPEELAAYLRTTAEVDPQQHMRQYLHANPHVRWGQDYTLWLRGRDRWVLAATDPAGPFRFEATLQDAIALLRGVPGGSRVVLHVHPCYYGFRAAADQDPLGWAQSPVGASAPVASYLDLAGLKHDVAQQLAATQEVTAALAATTERVSAGLAATTERLTASLAAVEARVDYLHSRMTVMEQKLAEMGDHVRQNNRILEAARKRKLGRYIF